MEKTRTKLSPKFGKISPQSGVSWSSNARGTTKVELKERLPDKIKAHAAKSAPKPPAKEYTKPLDFKLHTGERAVKRAMFNFSVATKFYVMEIQKKQAEKLQKMIEDEEIRLLRKEMVPKAQLMPFFDKPFYPQRSSRPLTMPREPSLGILNNKCWNGAYSVEQCRFQHAHA